MNARIALLVSRVEAASSRRRASSTAVAACACSPTCARCRLDLSTSAQDLLDALERLEHAQERRE